MEGSSDRGIACRFRRSRNSPTCVARRREQDRARKAEAQSQETAEKREDRLGTLARLRERNRARMAQAHSQETAACLNYSKLQQSVPPPLSSWRVSQRWASIKSALLAPALLTW